MFDFRKLGSSAIKGKHERLRLLGLTTESKKIKKTEEETRGCIYIYILFAEENRMKMKI